ncbi:MAG: DUF1824 family protein [Leptolyngbyaceae cyanobacterium bins.59]|nr:DUF1824 family protein [Leptolyngbyaceae cyanobacterium bins.59]
MTPSQLPTDLSLEAAHALLKRFDCTRQDFDPLPEKGLVRQALYRVADASDHQILGICADTEAEGLAALKQYAQALQHQIDLDDRPLSIEGPSYTKFNPRSGLCYCESYQGEQRGVIVCCQSAYDGGLNETYGHLPLDLFA